MYLKSIEVQGFKSFANRILFEFHNGITGIVGPNGSGKSNVSDAVRWVLGEQSAKQLRGGNMQDVIFAGTEMRKPQGFAYVAITLDNSDHILPVDFDEVVVSRRLYRSGESEYKINGSPCRLKDINEMFYDTGIGQEGYSIIGQGQIDRILSGKADERRELFDEAAGITKFKRRKNSAVKKLESERTNLVRITDILSELEKQVGPLKKQSDDAKEYLRLKDDLKKYEINGFLIESGSLKADLERIISHTTIVEGDKETALRQQDELRDEYKSLEELISELDSQISEATSKVAEAEKSTTDLNGQINVLNEQINTEHMNAEHIGSRIASIEKQKKEYEDDLATRQTEEQSISDTFKEADDVLKEAQTQLQDIDKNISELERRIEETKTGMIDAINERGQKLAEGQGYETQLEQIRVRSSEVAQRLLVIKSDESTLQSQLSDEKSRFDTIATSITAITDSQTGEEEKATALQKEVTRLSVSLNHMQSEYQNLSARLDSLKNLAERYDGYGNSIKRVMETKDRIHGIHGVVADIIAVDKDYEIAIETALGGRIQNVVTDSEQTAKTLIEYLKKNKYGRATFLPLTSVGSQNQWQAGDVMKEVGVIDIASNLVKTDTQYEGLLRYLLGRIIVVDNIDHAIAIEKKYHYEYRIVTIEGEQLNPGGSMSGGAFKNSSNLLGRKREIDELQKQLDTVLERSGVEEEQLKNTQAQLETTREKIESLKSELQQKLLEKTASQSELDHIEQKISGLLESATDLEHEHEQLSQQVTDITSKKDDIKLSIEELDDRKTTLESESSQASSELEIQRKNRETQSEKVTSLQVEASKREQALSFSKENIKRIEDEIARLVAEMGELTVQNTSSSATVDAKLAEIEEKKQQIATLATEIEESKQRGALLESRKKEKSEQQKAYFDKRDEISTRITDLEKELTRLESQKEKCDEKLQNQTSYMWSEYEITLENATEYQDETLTDLSSIKRATNDTKEAIKQLGNVNVNAIEDYKSISERYDFMSTQHADLVEAEKTLVNIIQELDTGMRRQFETQFENIKREFDKVFKALFGGGRGTLKLDEDVDMLEAGIQIIAEPPGKKLQNMMQLSGGEKALTAIALLFAIQDLHPSPFALLDEIEAALDDSNVDRFANYLKKLTHNTQFIVITHRRGTMIAADRLYGITMQEKGVSTLVSVNLIEDKLD